MKKGFTLIELLSVIVIIAIVSLITFPMISTYLKKSRETLYDVQIEDIKKSTEKWATDNINLLDKYHINDTYVPLELIQDLGYLEKDDVINPNNKEVMEGCISIIYSSDTKNYNYSYEEKTCLAMAEATNKAYVIYEFDEVTGGSKKASISKEAEPAALKIIEQYEQQNRIYALGQQNSGLFDLENEYVFSGNDSTYINNYVEYENKTWRILSIDKTDYTMKLMAVTGSTSLWSSIQNVGDIPETKFEKSTSYQSLTDSVSSYSKLVDSWNNGIVDNVETNRYSLELKLSETPIVSKVGLMSVYDYMSASTSTACNSNFLNTECKNNNYIATMFSGKNIWTMNSDGTKIWYLNSTGSLGLELSSNATYYLYSSIKLPVDVYITNATAIGSSVLPYKLK